MQHKININPFIKCHYHVIFISKLDIGDGMRKLKTYTIWALEFGMGLLLLFAALMGFLWMKTPYYADKNYVAAPLSLADNESHRSHYCGGISDKNFVECAQRSNLLFDSITVRYHNDGYGESLKVRTGFYIGKTIILSLQNTYEVQQYRWQLTENKIRLLDDLWF